MLGDASEGFALDDWEGMETEGNLKGFSEFGNIALRDQKKIHSTSARVVKFHEGLLGQKASICIKGSQGLSRRTEYYLYYYTTPGTYIVFTFSHS